MSTPPSRHRLLVPILLLLPIPMLGTPAEAVTYYVSSVSGDDANAGTSTGAPLRTVSAVNALPLQPADEVRFFCGETWTAETLRITRSGSTGAAILYGSHPADCADKPVLRGDRAISGWSLHQGQIWVADLDQGPNAGLFPLGINQLFDADGRLPLGRWPNIDAPDGGWSTIDDQPGPFLIEDAQRPAGDWTGAVAHIKGIRWYILNREVLQTVGLSLDLGDPAECWGGDCTGWGYYLSDHLLALDREGEWHYDPDTNRVFLFSAAGTPADGALSGSVVIAGDSDPWGMVILGVHLQEHIEWVTVEDLRLERGFDAGITTPLNLEANENQSLILRDIDIIDMATTGVRLRTWVWDAAANGNGPNGWRGGTNQTLRNLLIEGPNHFGIDSYATFSQFDSNTIRDVALIENLGRSGMGCGFTGTNCTENGDGIRLNHDPGSPNHTSRDLIVWRNRLENIGMNGIDVFGRSIDLQDNILDRTCVSKGDCGAIRTFGRTDLAGTPVRDITLDRNIIRDVEGNTDGCRDDFDPLLGIGLYIDNFSSNVTVTDNTIASSSAIGLLFQRSTGSATGNVIYDNADRTAWGAQVRLVGSETSVATFENNAIFSLGPERWTLSLEQLSQLASSNDNRFMSPWRDEQVLANGSGLTLAGWQALSGEDGASSAHWYGRSPGDPALSTLLVNESFSAADLDPGPGSWLDLDQQPVTTPVSVPARSGLVLVGNAAAIFADGFESGNTVHWSSASP